MDSGLPLTGGLAVRLPFPAVSWLRRHERILLCPSVGRPLGLPHASSLALRPSLRPSCSLARYVPSFGRSGRRVLSCLRVKWHRGWVTRMGIGSFHFFRGGNTRRNDISVLINFPDRLQVLPNPLRTGFRAWVAFVAPGLDLPRKVSEFRIRIRLIEGVVLVLSLVVSRAGIGLTNVVLLKGAVVVLVGTWCAAVVVFIRTLRQHAVDYRDGGLDTNVHTDSFLHCVGARFHDWSYAYFLSTLAPYSFRAWS